MLKNGVRHLPVTEGNRKDIIGINTTTDFAKYLERRLESSDSQSSYLYKLSALRKNPRKKEIFHETGVCGMHNIRHMQDPCYDLKAKSTSPLPGSPHSTVQFKPIL